jgi:hypothetical protein
MDKERIIKNIHKILFVFEKEDFYNYYACLTNQIILLSAYDNDVITDNVMFLKGLRNLGEEVTHYEVRHTVLHCMNDIDRRLVI